MCVITSLVKSHSELSLVTLSKFSASDTTVKMLGKVKAAKYAPFLID